MSHALRVPAFGGVHSPHILPGIRPPLSSSSHVLPQCCKVHLRGWHIRRRARLPLAAPIPRPHHLRTRGGITETSTTTPQTSCQDAGESIYVCASSCHKAVTAPIAVTTPYGHGGPIAVIVPVSAYARGGHSRGAASIRVCGRIFLAQHFKFARCKYCVYTCKEYDMWG